MKLFVPLAGSSPIVTKYDSPARDFIQINQRRPQVSFVDDPACADVIVIFEEWSTKFKDYMSELSRCPFVYGYLEKILVINWDDLGRGFLPGCYTSLNPRNYDSGLHRAIPYPYDINSEVLAFDRSAREIEPNYLFSFRGTTKSSAVRDRLFELLRDHPDGRITRVDTEFHHHNPEQMKSYAKEIIDSLFALCPRGWSPSTYRLYEVMALGRCPIIISDDWIPVPGIDWESCSIRVCEREITAIPSIAAANRHKALSLGRKAREVWEHNFSPQARPGLFLDAITQLHRNRYGTADELRRRWRSSSFLKANGWLLRQRLYRKLIR